MSDANGSRILPAFKTTGRVPDRRAAPRHAPTRDRLWLGWWVSPSEFRVQDATLLNISSTGAALLVPEQIVADPFVWLHLETAACSACTQGLVVGCEPHALGVQKVRLQFVTPCPLNFFQAALGIRSKAMTAETAVVIGFENRTSDTSDGSMSEIEGS